MKSRFSSHITRLREGSGPDMELVTLVCRVMQAKLKARGLWAAPPAFVGCPEIESWFDERALQLLALDAIETAIVRRLRALCARMDAGDNVDGFVFMNLDNFLTERQRYADPIGYATYQWVMRVLDERVEANVLVVEDGVCRRPDMRDGVALDRASLGELLSSHARWSSLMRCIGRGGTEAGVELSALFEHLEAHVACGFRVRDLVGILREEARRWQSLLVEDGAPDEWESAVQRVLQSRQLLTRLESEIDRSGGQERRRDDLLRVLRAWRDAYDRGEEWSQADLARTLGMSKTTVSDHVRRLRRLVTEIDPHDSNDLPLWEQSGERRGTG